jgi:hypothetical protein
MSDFVPTPAKTLYDMFTSRQGLAAAGVAALQTASFCVFVWAQGGWVFTSEWETVLVWVMFFVYSAGLMIAWAFHTYRDAEERRERAATEAVGKAMQETIAARRETFSADEASYKLRQEWRKEREVLENDARDLRKQRRDDQEKQDEERRILTAELRELRERSLQMQQSLHTFAQLRMDYDFVAPRLKAAEAWLDANGRRVVTHQPGNYATVENKPT